MKTLYPDYILLDNIFSKYKDVNIGKRGILKKRCQDIPKDSEVSILTRIDNSDNYLCSILAIYEYEDEFFEDYYGDEYEYYDELYIDSEDYLEWFITNRPIDSWWQSRDEVIVNINDIELDPYNDPSITKLELYINYNNSKLSQSNRRFGNNRLILKYIKTY